MPTDLRALLLKHLAIGAIEHFIQSVAFVPFRRADADCHSKAFEMLGRVPVVQFSANTINHVLRVRCIRVGPSRMRNSSPP